MDSFKITKPHSLKVATALYRNKMERIKVIGNICIKQIIILTVNPSHLSRTQTVSFNTSPTPLESS